MPCPNQLEMACGVCSLVLGDKLTTAMLDNKKISLINLEATLKATPNLSVSNLEFPHVIGGSSEASCDKLVQVLL